MHAAVLNVEAIGRVEVLDQLRDFVEIDELVVEADGERRPERTYRFGAALESVKFGALDIGLDVVDVPQLLRRYNRVDGSGRDRILGPRCQGR